MKLEAMIRERQEELKQIYSDFPFMCCGETSGHLARKDGVYIVSGEYHGPFSKEFRRKAKRFYSRYPECNPGFKPDFTSIPHVFGFLPEENIFLDLSIAQFHPDNPDYLIISPGDKSLRFQGQSLKPYHVLTVNRVRILKPNGHLIDAPGYLNLPNRAEYSLN
ncbi:hypothetical protein H6503_06060 [Candidatus Woesearchaeota archaeon]|nr:hypothetical protein [Candidatus Woesearchaeota archaeon]